MIRGTDARTVTDIPTGKQLSIIAFQISTLSLMRDPVGIMEGWSVAKYQIPSTKLQTNLKFQYQMTKTVLVRRRRIGHCDLCDICDLLFGIFWSAGWIKRSESTTSQHWPSACAPCRPNEDCGYR